MPLFSKEDFYSFISVAKECFDFIVNCLTSLLEIVRSYSILFVPLFFAVLLFVVFLVGYLILEASESAYGTKLHNPNNYYLTSFPIIKDGFKLYKKKMHKNAIERDRVNRLNYKISQKAKDLEDVEEFFKHNPWAYRFHLHGQTYFRPGWQSVNWKKGKYINNKSYSDVSFDVELAEKQAKANRANFATKKIKKKKQ